MATWAEFANAEPDLAAFARERMEGRIVYQATLRLDGGPRVHPVSPWIAAGLLCVSFRDTSPKRREVARDPRYALHTAQPWGDHAGEFGEFMALGRLEQITASHPAVTARPGQTPYGLVHYVCSIEEAVATEYSDDEMPVYRRWKPSAGDATGGDASGASVRCKEQRVRYMVIETFRQDPQAVYARAAERGRVLPAGLVYVDSWIDERGLDRCFQLMETEDPRLFNEWMAQWSDLVEFEIVPVIDTAEAARRSHG